MIKFTIHDLFPDFILSDRNGYAMAKAIERALQIMCETIQTGVNTVRDVEKMPEWRLDEMAWELGCLYDYNADVEAKRRWVRDASTLYAYHGTPEAIYRYLEGVFKNVSVEEGAEPYHFSVSVGGEWTPERENWARQAIQTAKNVRSVLDDILIGNDCRITVGTKSDFFAFYPPKAGEDVLCGTLPE